VWQVAVDNGPGFWIVVDAKTGKKLNIAYVGGAILSSR